MKPGKRKGVGDGPTAVKQAKTVPAVITRGQKRQPVVSDYIKPTDHPLPTPTSIPRGRAVPLTQKKPASFNPPKPSRIVGSRPPTNSAGRGRGYRTDTTSTRQTTETNHRIASSGRGKSSNEKSFEFTSGACGRGMPPSYPSRRPGNPPSQAVAPQALTDFMPQASNMPRGRGMHPITRSGKWTENTAENPSTNFDSYQIENILRMRVDRELIGPLKAFVVEISPECPDVDGVYRRRQKIVLADNTGIVIAYIFYQPINFVVGDYINIYRYRLVDNTLKLHENSWTDRTSPFEIRNEILHQAESAMFATIKPRKTVSQACRDGNAEQKTTWTVQGKVTTVYPKRFSPDKENKRHKLSRELWMTEGNSTLVINLWESAATVEINEYDNVVLMDSTLSYNNYRHKPCMNINYPDQIMIIEGEPEERFIEVKGIDQSPEPDTFRLTVMGEGVFERVDIRRSLFMSVLPDVPYNTPIRKLANFIPMTAKTVQEGRLITTFEVVDMNPNCDTNLMQDKDLEDDVFEDVYELTNDTSNDINDDEEELPDAEQEQPKEFEHDESAVVTLSEDEDHEITEDQISCSQRPSQTESVVESLEESQNSTSKDENYLFKIQTDLEQSMDLEN